MTITGDDSEFMTSVKAHLGEQLLMFHLGPLHHFVGIEVSST